MAQKQDAGSFLLIQLNHNQSQSLKIRRLLRASIETGTFQDALRQIEQSRSIDL